MLGYLMAQLMVLSVNLRPARRKLPCLGVYRSVNGFIGTDEWFGRSTCSPPAASCLLYALTDRLMALIALVG